MDVLFALLIFLLIAVAVMTVVGHGIWVFLAWFFRALTNSTPTQPRPLNEYCPSCGSVLEQDLTFCRCGWRRPSAIVTELLKDLAATERQAARFHRSGKLDQDAYENLLAQIEAERDRLDGKAAPRRGEAEEPAPATATARASVTTFEDEVATDSPVVVGAFIAAEDEIVIEPVPSFRHDDEEPPTDGRAWQPISQPPPPPTPRRSFTEVLNAFMEESNIRWGEIIGGLLIIGCSTALVVSLWSEISQIPVLKFLIFTTVTAALFGVGLYTEHRWKLPTTSRGILTTATLLVPLNFLAIAAVSSGESPGALVIGSELIAPAIFLCLVFFAGKVLTPNWSHLLVAGVLGSSIGQLLVRHFASPDLQPALLIALAAFPLFCYVASCVWMLKQALADGEITENETIAIYITLGAMTFAAALPFALLLYKSGPVPMTMMYLAPLVSVGGFPLLATGMFLWQRATAKELVTTRTVGTSLAILGTVIVVSGMILAWPNPASIVPAALFNFAVFTGLAVLLRLPAAHIPAAICFALAYLVLFHVLAGHVAWQNLRVTSLLQESLSVSSGQALAPLFILFVGAAEWLRSKRSEAESRAYLAVACAVALVSSFLVWAFGIWSLDGPHTVWIVFAIYSVGAFWIAARNGWVQFSWIGSVLLLFALQQAFVQLNWSFRWQIAMLAHASICAIAAIVCRSNRFDEKVLTAPLNYSAFASSFVAVWCLIQAGPWQTTAMQSQRLFWLAGIWLLLLWLNRSQKLFAIFQVALTFGVVLGIKATLQKFDWYSYLPHVFLHPWGLQIQGTALVLLSLVWVALRLLSEKLQFVESDGPSTSDEVSDPTRVGWRKLHKLKFVGQFIGQARWSFDRFVLWVVLVAFVLFSAYGALSGITRELTAQDVSNPSWDIVGFPHEQILQLGSWIVLALLIIAMLANLWERRRSIYLFGVVAAATTMIPLLAGMWEPQTATASAWRWLAALFLIVASLPLWFHERVAESLKLIDWPSTEFSRDVLLRRVRVLLLALCVAPILLLTLYPALRAIYYMPVHGPSAGFFFFLEDSFSYGLPLVLVALAMIVYAVRERLPRYAFAAGFFLNFTATMAYLLAVVAVGGLMDRVVLAEVVQLNAIVFAAYAIAWMIPFARWSHRLNERMSREARALLLVQSAMAATAIALFVVPATVKVVFRPEYSGNGVQASGSWWAWVAFILTVVAAGLYSKISQRRLEPPVLFAALLVATCLTAFGFVSPVFQVWTASHVFLIGVVLTGWLMLLARWLPGWLSNTGKQRPTWTNWLNLSESWASDCLRYSVVAGLFGWVLCLRRWSDDPNSDWWSIAPLLTVSALFATLNWITFKRRHIYLAALVFSSASLIWAANQYPTSFAFIEVQIVTVSLSSIFWLILDLRARRLSGQPDRTSPAFHHLAAIWSLIFVAFLLLGEVLVALDLRSTPIATMPWLSIASLGLLMVACLWDRSAKFAGAGLYLIGFFSITTLIARLDVLAERFLWTTMIGLAVYTVLVAIIWRNRAKIMSFTDRWRLPRRIDESVTELKWLTMFQTTLIVTTFLIGYWVVLSFADWPSRAVAAVAVASIAVVFTLMAEGQTRPEWQRAAIIALVIGLVLFGWSVLVPGVNGTWFNRAVILMVEMFALTAVYGLVLSKALEREPDWTSAAQSCVPWIAGAGVVALLFSLATEVFYQVNFGMVMIPTWALIAIGLTLVVGLGLCLLFALSTKHDPLKLSERGRMNYVYAAEVLLALFFMHVRLTMPWLFTGFFERYWPLVVMAIAYLGVGTAETLRRRKLLVLAQPIERTGAFLPLLPVIGFWLAQSQVDYSALLFIVGGLYGLLSILRRSFVFGVLAALAGNAGLWYLLHRSDDFHFLQHPQLWLIPVALSVLIAAYLNEDDFTEEQMAGVRYLSLVMIYASSTADIFINGVAESPWLPLVLAGLSLAGIFCGIIFRIRGFLLLGSVFLLLAIITMIWYASANLGWTWLWYVAGIVTGATIIFMFAMFEKKRSEVLRVVEGLREWDR